MDLFESEQSSRVNRKNSANGLFTSLASFWCHSYASDYLGFALVFTGHIVVSFFMEPFHMMFSISDLAISFPHTEHERISVMWSIVYAIALPLATIIITNFVTRASAHKHHISVLGFAFSVFLTAFLTDVLKNAAGKPRPDFLARCKPKPDTIPNALVDWTVCTEKDMGLLQEGWRSFPSGHSSFSFSGLGYVGLFLTGQLRIFAHHGQAEGRGFGRALFCMLPLLGASLIAISRCQDYRHDVYDVSTGALLGFAVAYFSYRRYWPSLGSAACSEPWPSPAEDLRKDFKSFDECEEDGIHGVAFVSDV